MRSLHEWSSSSRKVNSNQTFILLGKRGRGLFNFNMECKVCKEQEELEIEVHPSDTQEEVLMKLSELSDFKVHKLAEGASLICEKCSYSNLLFKDKRADLFDVYMDSIGFSKRIHIAKTIDKKIVEIVKIILILAYLTMVTVNKDLLSGSSVISIIGALALLTIIPLHELSHYVTSKILGYSPKLHLLSNSYTEPFKKWGGIVVVLSPIFFLTIAYFIAMLAIPQYAGVLSLAAVLNIVGSSQDVRQAIAIYQCPKGSYVYGNFNTEVRAYLKDEE